MKNKLKCKLVFGSYKEVHLCQIIAGYQMLNDEKKIVLIAEYNPNYLKNKYNRTTLIEVVLENKIVLCYDLSDGYQNIHDFNEFDLLLDKINFYFKRSNKSQINSTLKNKHKILPLGLNYQVSCMNNPFDNFYDKSSNSIQNLKNYINHLRYYKRFVHKYYVKEFESKPDYSQKNYKLLYNVRLWNPDNATLEDIKKANPKLSEVEAKNYFEKRRNDLMYVTEQRIEMINALKENFGEKFVGGIARDDYSLKVAPELVVPLEMTNKFYFMKLLKQNFVCISTIGLHKSIGFKMGEYVAASRAILSDPIYYELPGDFTENKNYIQYNTTKELIYKAENLLANPELIHFIETNNFNYYTNFVCPDKMIENTLIQAGFII